MIDPSIQLDHFRWRNDNGSETSATWIYALDTNPSSPITPSATGIFRLRFAIRETAGAAGPNNTQYVMIQRINSGSWLLAGSTNPFQPADSPNLAASANVACTQQISSGGFTSGGQWIDSNSASQGTITLGASNSAEFEFTFILDPTNYDNTYTDGDILDIGVAESDGTLLDNYAVVASMEAEIYYEPGFSNIYLGSQQQTDPNHAGTTPINDVYYGAQRLYHRYLGP